MSIGPQSVFETNGPLVISETIDGETVIINLDSGSYYSLKHAGPSIWHDLQRPASVGFMAANLASRYGILADDASREVAALVERFLAEGLIRTSAEPADASARREQVPGALGTLGAFVPPTFERFSDMEALLLLDPIHDVDEAGWPHLPPAAQA